MSVMDVAALLFNMIKRLTILLSLLAAVSCLAVPNSNSIVTYGALQQILSTNSSGSSFNPTNATFYYPHLKQSNNVDAIDFTHTGPIPYISWLSPIAGGYWARAYSNGTLVIQSPDGFSMLGGGGGNTTLRGGGAAESYLQMDGTGAHFYNPAHSGILFEVGTNGIASGNGSGISNATPIIYVGASNSLFGNLARFRGTGTSDQSAGSNAVKLVALNGGGIVRLLEGTYWFDATLYVSNGVQIIGSGYNTVINLASNITAATNVISLQQGSGMRVSNLRVNGSAGQGLSLVGPQKGIVLTGSSNSIIDGCWVEHFGNVSTPSCIGINPVSSSDIQIVNNYVLDCVDGINSGAGSTRCFRLYIAGNRVWNINRDHGITAANLSECQIIGNTIFNIGGNGILLTRGYANVVANNYVSNCWNLADAAAAFPAAIAIGAAGSGITSDCTNNTISGNIIRANGSFFCTNGLYVLGGYRNSILNNDCYGGFTNPLVNLGTNSIVAGNRTNDTSQYIIQGAIVADQHIGDGALLSNIVASVVAGILTNQVYLSNLLAGGAIIPQTVISNHLRVAGNTTNFGNGFVNGMYTYTNNVTLSGGNQGPPLISRGDSSDLATAGLQYPMMVLINADTTANNHANLAASDNASGASPYAEFQFVCTSHGSDFGDVWHGVRGSNGFIYPLIVRGYGVVEANGPISHKTNVFVGAITGVPTNSAVTPVGWMPITNAGTVYFIGLFK